MTHLSRVFGALLRVDLATMLQYRGESLLWAIWGIIYPAVAMAMWQAAAQDPAEGSAITTYGAGAFAAYFLMTMVVGHMTAAWDAFELGYFIRSGGLSAWLLQPLLPIWKSLATNVAYKLVTLTILVPIWLVVGWIAQPQFSGDWTHIALGAVSLLLAAGIAFIWGYVVALLAFWTERNDAVGELWFGSSLLMGGRLAPIELLPLPLQYLAALLPFKWMLGFPSEVLMGRTSLEATLVGIGIQALWLAGGLVTFRLFWHAAVRRYSAVGA